ncbi:MAG: hypothetical protein ACM34K_19035 [Bacillota bacterium]
MGTNSEDNLQCELCGATVDQDNEFCPECGSIFIDGVKCSNHPDRDAEGVCIICSQAYCSYCGAFLNDIYLCEDHQNYEIIEGMARVYGINDAAQAEFVLSCLDRGGLHPILFSRKANPILFGEANYTLFRASGEYRGNLINEVKIMVPVQEVIKAVEIIKEIEQK